MLKKSNTVFFRKIMAVILVAAFSAIVLSSCNFLDFFKKDSPTQPEIPEEILDDDKELKFEGDYLVGFFMYFVLPDGTVFPTDDFKSPDMIGVYEYNGMRLNDDGTEYLYSSSFFGGGLFNIRVGIGNNGIAPNGEISIEATFIYTHELDGAVAEIFAVYQKEDRELYTKRAMGEHISDLSSGKESEGIHSSFSTDTLKEELKASKTDKNGVKTEIKYTASVKITFLKTDELLSAKIYEYDNNANLLGANEFDKDGIDRYLTELDYGYGNRYQTDEACEYVVIEEKYQRKDGSEYLFRKILNKATYDKTHVFYFPAGDGLIDGKVLAFFAASE
ncbi:MAG: hypothetical protein LBT20_04330 [Clostridiales bacterium]|nr:hypothetical protein [Clostridiales bacterium]